MTNTITVTLDTNVLGPAVLHKIEKAVDGLPIELGHVTVTAREQEDAYKAPPGQRILETAVWDESRWDEAVWGGASDETLFEKMLAVVSNGSFPRAGNREHLNHGQRNQLRDVMILAAHVRSGRAIFVTNEKRAFIGKDGSLRLKLEALCATKIMNVEEFCQYCEQLKNSGHTP